MAELSLSDDLQRCSIAEDAEAAAASAEAQADELWRLASTASSCESSKKRSFPSHTAVMKDIHGADYSALLRCPMDGRAEHPFGCAGPRLLCAHGCVARCRVEFDECGRGYTGLFRGAPHCVVRLSTAVAPATGVTRHVLGKLKDGKLFPCVAIKAARGGGAPSGNLLFAGAKTGHKEPDFFAHGVSTQVTHKVPAALAPALRAFERYSAHPLALGLSEWASLDAAGAAAPAAAPRFPWCLALHPAETLRVPPLPPGARFDGFIDALLTIDAGTALYDVFAIDSPAALGGAEPEIVKIGRVVTTSAMAYSPPDCALVFKHQKKEEDYALRPDWVPELATPVAGRDGKPGGTAEKHAGSKFFDHHIRRCRR